MQGTGALLTESQISLIVAPLCYNSTIDHSVDSLRAMMIAQNILRNVVEILNTEHKKSTLDHLEHLQTLSSLYSKQVETKDKDEDKDFHHRHITRDCYVATIPLESDSGSSGVGTLTSVATESWNVTIK